MPQFELVMPCYNEGPNLTALFERTVAAALKRGFTPGDFQLVLVDNGSSDNSAVILQELARHPKADFLRVVRVMPNRGYGFGIWSGLQSTQAEFIGWSHGDGQCDPDDALRAWLVLREQPGPTLYKGRRLQRPSRAAWLLSRFFEIATLLLAGVRLHEINAQPKVFPRELLNVLSTPPHDYTFDLHVLLQAHRAGYVIRAMDVRFLPRTHGHSHWAVGIRSRARTIRGFLKYLVREGRRPSARKAK